MASSQRELDIFNVVDAYLSEHDAWAATTDRTDWPDEDYWNAYNDMSSTVLNGDVPGSCRLLVQAAENLAKECQVFDEQAAVDQQMPHDGFWSAREAMAHIRAGMKRNEIAQLKPLETIRELRQQKVSDEQIARIYGLYMANGEPASHLVQRELDNPGSIVGPDSGWIDPRLREAERDNADGDRRTARADAGLTSKRGNRRVEAEKPCPETPQELWQQNVSAAQSAKMLRMPEQEVSAMFARFAREQDEAQRQQKLQELGGQDRPSQPPAAATSTAADEPEINSREQEILELSREGLSASEIGKELGIDGRKVAGVLRVLKQRAEDVTEPTAAAPTI